MILWSAETKQGAAQPSHAAGANLGEFAKLGRGVEAVTCRRFSGILGRYERSWLEVGAILAPGESESLHERSSARLLGTSLLEPSTYTTPLSAFWSNTMTKNTRRRVTAYRNSNSTLWVFDYHGPSCRQSSNAWKLEDIHGCPRPQQRLEAIFQRGIIPNLVQTWLPLESSQFYS